MPMTGARRALPSRVGVLALLVLLLAMLGERDARADASGEAYSDAKAIIEELITQEFAESASVWLACSTFKKPDGHDWRTNQLPRYYLRSLQKLEERQWGSLPTTLRDETVDAIADYVLFAARAEHARAKNAGKGDGVLKSIREFLDRPIAWSVDVFVDEKHTIYPLQTVCQQAMEIGGANRQLFRTALVQHIHHAQPQPAEVDTCSVDDLNDTSSSMACALGRSVKAAMQGKGTEAQANILHFALLAAGEKDVQPLSADLRERFLTALLVSLKGTGAEGKRVDDLLQPITAFLGATPRDVTCGTSGADDLVAFLTGKAPETIGLGCVAAWSDFANLQLSTAPTNGSATSTPLVDFITTLPRELREDAPGQDAVMKALLCATKHPACTNNVVDLTKVNGTLTLGDSQKTLLTWTLGSHKEKDTTSLDVREGRLPVVRLITLSRTIQEAADKLRAALQTAFPNQSTDTRKLFGHAVQLVRLAAQLRRLKLFSGDQLEFAGLLGATLNVLGDTATCATPKVDVQPATAPSVPSTPPASTSTCAAVSSLAGLLKSRGTEMSAMIDAAARRDHRALAVTLLETVLPEDEGTSVTCNVDRPPYRRLVLSFVTYVLDDARDDGRTVSRDAFRAAAVDLVRCVSDSGLHRSPKNAGSFFLHLLFRSASFRASWNAAYDQGNGSSFRVVPSLVGFNVHVPFTARQSSWYAGLEWSCIDWLAPLSEVAIRRGDAGYSHNELLIAEAIRPRMDLFLGLPMLTEHLALSAGVSFRFAAPQKGKPGESESALTANQFTYVPFWENRNAASWLELGAGVHYVF